MTASSRPRQYLASTVYAALRRAILEREFDPGEPLTEHELCRRFKVSRTPVREALAKLERDQLVRVVPKKGAFVRTISHDQIREAYQVREALEALAVRLAAPRLERAELEDFARRFRELKARGAAVRYTDVRPLGEEFHRFLLKRADNGTLLTILEQIREQISSVWTMSILAPRRVQGLVREHLAIIDALERDDAPRAERLMVEHVRRVREAIFKLVD
ncbi:MAG TPA: GntR family transcriptional regulator [Methylomirabilota bacterium]|jgi:DNA-binding GntR family transcriptional regulator|nr:GntR family transcriptional regulator [Methylomirabilota bacterium]